MAAGPNTVMAESLYFVETGAGVYSGSITVPANTLLVDVIVHAEALWAAGTSAALIVGETADPNGLFDAVDLKATDLLAGESISFDHTGAQQGADVDIFTETVNTAVIDNPALQHLRRRMLTTARNLTAEVTSVGVGTTGRTLVTFLYCLPARQQINVT